LRLLCRIGLFGLLVLFTVVAQGAVGHAGQQTPSQTPDTSQDIRLPFTRGEPKTAISQALTAARKDGTLVLINLGADWCIDCRVLEHFFETPQVSSFLRSNFHIVTIDVGFYPDSDKQKNVDVAARYGFDLMKSGIPAIIVLNAAGQTIASTREGQWRTARNFGTNDVLAYLEGFPGQR